MSIVPADRPIAIFSEHPEWFKPLFAELDRRGTPYVKLHADEHVFDPAEHPAYSLVFNRMSPSAYLRGRGNAIFYTQAFLAHLERRGIRVVHVAGPRNDSAVGSACMRSVGFLNTLSGSQRSCG